MTRLFCLGLVVALTSYVPIQAQQNILPKTFTNSIGMKFVWIPPGTFMMGSPKKEEERGNDEAQHRVTLTNGFYMGIHLVTQEQWQAVMGDNPSFLKCGKNLPVDKVSWADCQKFIKKLRDKDKNAYRLPTEAEWEYACRAGTTTPYYGGATISTDQANYDGDFVYGTGKNGVNREKATPVGTFPPNAWGLHDMHGNLWEWCQDWYGEYPKQNVFDPQGPVNGEARVLRGGSWVDYPRGCRSASRTRSSPECRDLYYGLRVCFFVEGTRHEAFHLPHFVRRLLALAGGSGSTAPVRKRQDDKEPSKHFTNSIGMKFVWIPPGTFTMGSPKDEENREPCWAGKETQHKVTLTKGF